MSHWYLNILQKPDIKYLSKYTSVNLLMLEYCVYNYKYETIYVRWVLGGDNIKGKSKVK